MNTKIDADIYELAISYQELQSTRKVAKKHGISQTTVRRRLAGLINKPVRHTCDDDFFFHDTIASFYWSGFMAADGCVQERGKGNNKVVRLGLASVDREHLEKFKNIVSFTGPIYDSQYKSSEVNICSAKMVEGLCRFNIVPRKTLVYEFPEWIISHKYVNHFIRGYFDGDGSTSFAKGKTENSPKNSVLVLSGTKEFLYTCKYTLEVNCGIAHSTRFGTDRVRKINDNNFYELRYSGNTIVSSIVRFLYKNSGENTRLDRKYYKNLSIIQ